MSGRDHYEVLGVSRNAGTGDIRRAYRARALRYHPDVYAGADAGRRFKEVADAYDILHDPARRARYDAVSRPARGLDARAMPWPITRRPRDAPKRSADGGACRRASSESASPSTTATVTGLAQGGRSPGRARAARDGAGAWDTSSSAARAATDRHFRYCWKWSLSRSQDEKPAL